MIADVSPFDPPLTDLPDRVLLARFAERRDEAAFAVLVGRYGPLVVGAGRRTAGGGPGSAADADDAFQAAFFALARHAAKLVDRMGPGRTLGGWLYRVAVNAVLQAKRGETARRRRERAVARDLPPQRPSAAAADAERAEAVGALEEELAALPPAERGAVVLCHLRGRTQRQAAAELGVPFGTFRRRLDRGRARLRGRLEARGVTAGAGALAASLAAAGEACAGAIDPAEAAAVAADAARRLPPPHVLAPRVPTPAGADRGPWVALGWEPLLTAAAGLAVAALAAVGLFDLLGGGFSDPPDPPPAAPVAVRSSPTAGGML